MVNKLTDDVLEGIEKMASVGLKGSSYEKPFVHPNDAVLMVAEIRRLRKVLNGYQELFDHPNDAILMVAEIRRLRKVLNGYQELFDDLAQMKQKCGVLVEAHQTVMRLNQ